MNDSMRQRLETLAERGSPRGADAVLGAAQTTIRRRQRRSRGGFAALLVLLVGASVTAYVVASRDGDSSTGVATDPDQPTLTTVPEDDPVVIDGVTAPPPDVLPWTIWISEPVIPVSGADVVLALRSSTTASATFGAATNVDRWDGKSWQQVRYGATCVRDWKCRGELSRDPIVVRLIGLVTPDFGVGQPEWLRIEGLEPGFYRLRKTSGEGAEATGAFTVVDEPVSLVDIGSAGVTVEPVVVTPPANVVHIKLQDPRAAGVRALQRWTGTSWEDTTEQLVPARHPAGGPEPGWVLPPLQPGAYRILHTSGDNMTATGVFWVDEGRDPTRTEDGAIVLDDGRLVVESFPADFKPRTMPRSHTSPLGRQVSVWDYASREHSAVVSISIERGAGATEALAANAVVEGVTRQGATVYRADDPGIPTVRPIGWSPASDVVVWLGSNSAEIDLIALSEGIRYEDPPAR